MNILSVQYFIDHLPAMRSFLDEIVAIESPSLDKVAVDQLAQRIVMELERLGGEITIDLQDKAGNNVLCRWGSGPGGILLLFHMDTVYESGTYAQRPLCEVEGKLFGPGVLDMKASIALLIECIRGFQKHNLWPRSPITALFTSDEETGSRASRAIIESEARKAKVVFCLEPALANGALKTARKGTGEIEISVKGVAAHAGVNHEQGRNAIEELAHHILSVQRQTDYKRGTTVNVGVISGGTRTNVVPSEAHARVDLRVSEPGEITRLQEWVNNCRPVIDGVEVQATIELNRPPMPRDETMLRTFNKARLIASILDLDLSEGSTGGGSDANFVAPLGVPVLDGLGAVGDGAHSEHEYIKIDSLPERAALLSALMLNW